MKPALVFPIVALVCTIGIAGPASSPASAAERTKSDPGDGTPVLRRWIPSISAGLVVAEDRVKGSVDSSIDGFSDAGAFGKTVPRLQILADVMSPALGRSALGPRVVFFGGLQLKGPNEQNEVAGAGGFVDRRRLEGLIAKTRPNPRTLEWPPPESFDNQGSGVTSQYDTLGWVLGLGLVFEFPRRENEDPALRVRPCVTYVGEPIEFVGGTEYVTGRPFGDPPVGEYTIHWGTASKDEILHYVGPGLDVELVLISAEKVTLGLFAKVSFLWNAGDSSFSFVDRGGLSTYHVDVEDFRIRPGGGLRLAWRGGV